MCGITRPWHRPLHAARPLVLPLRGHALRQRRLRMRCNAEATRAGARDTSTAAARHERAHHEGERQRRGSPRAAPADGGNGLRPCQWPCQWPPPTGQRRGQPHSLRESGGEAAASGIRGAVWRGRGFQRAEIEPKCGSIFEEGSVRVIAAAAAAAAAASSYGLVPDKSRRIQPHRPHERRGRQAMGRQTVQKFKRAQLSDGTWSHVPTNATSCRPSRVAR